MLEVFLRTLFACVVGGLCGVAVYAAGITCPILHVAAGTVVYFAVETFFFPR